MDVVLEAGSFGRDVRILSCRFCAVGLERFVIVQFCVLGFGFFLQNLG